GALWLFAALGKLRNVREFAEDVRDYRILPDPAARAFGAMLPFVELALGGCMLFGLAPKAAAFTSCALLILFTVAMVMAISRKLKIRCHCFGELGRAPVSWPVAGRNL